MSLMKREPGDRPSCNQIPRGKIMHVTTIQPTLERSSIAKNTFIFRTAILAAAALFFAIIPASLLAQQAKMLHGQVHDPLGALVTGASVDLLEYSRVIAHTTTGRDGSFQFPLPE